MCRTTFASPIVAWDCQEKEEVFLRPYALLFPGDNPMQAELCSSAGLCCNHFCRTCKVGGSQKHKQSDEGFSELFKVSSASTSIRTSSDMDARKEHIARQMRRSRVRLSNSLRHSSRRSSQLSQRPFVARAPKTHLHNLSSTILLN